MSIAELSDIDTETATPLMLGATEHMLQDYEARVNEVSSDVRLAVFTLIRHARADLKSKTVPYAILEQIQAYYS